VAESARILFGKFSMRSHLDELAAAMGVLAENESVDVARIAGLGNSEGTLHVLHYATSSQHVPLGRTRVAGAFRVDRSARSAVPIRPASDPVSGGAELMPLVEAAAAHYSAGEPMNSDPPFPTASKWCSPASNHRPTSHWRAKL